MTNPALPISRKAREIPEALSVYFNQLVYELRRKQRDIITLSLGESYFAIPPFDFGALDFDRGYHYSHSRGIPELREKIAGYYRDRYGATIGADDVIVSAGSKILIYMCMMAILEPGDSVVMHEPAWLSYQEHARLTGAEARFIPFNTPCDRFHEYVDARTRLLILNNPNNPAGRTYTREELADLHRMCRSRGIYLLVDEAYSDYVLDDSFVSLSKVVPDLDGAIIVNSLSKNMGMSGWRVGYVIAAEALLGPLLKLNQHLITCAPTILQQYLAHYFDEILANTLSQVTEVVRKRSRVGLVLDELGLRCLPGTTTFYFFVETGGYGGSIHDLALYLLLEKGISVVPGSAYGATTANFVRVSIGTESEERIREALLVLRETLAGPPVDSARVHTELARLHLPEFS